MPRHCYVLRVFTRGEAGGNHLGVVADPTGLDTAAMQSIAADLGFSETVFLDWGQREIPRVRIFTPTAELPFAGHPLVGMAWTLKVMGPGRSPDRLACDAFEVAIRMDGPEAVIEVPLSQPVRAAPEGAPLAAAVGLPAPVSACWVEMPIPYLVLEAESAQSVAEADPASARTFAEAGADMVYVFGWEDPGSVRARFFAPGHGVFEDPATGSAAVALAASLRAAGRTAGRLSVHQGYETGHPSTIRLGWDADSATIGGSVRRDEVRWLRT